MSDREPSCGPFPEEEVSVESGGRFPVVGIGGSAGALDAFRDLLSTLPPDTGMAFVYVPHLDPNYASSLAEIFSRVTQMPVQQASDRARVEPDHVYILPPNATMTISGGELRLTRRMEAAGHHLPIDTFLRSLAQDQKANGVAIILSGASSDGALGLKDVKDSGGITFAQDDSARHREMPRSAVLTGSVDFVRSPVEIAQELARLGRHPYVRISPEAPEPFGAGSGEFLQEIIDLLRAGRGIDLSAYRPATLKRRIARRMALSQTDRLPDYIQLLRDNTGELDALYDGVLIKVTAFFRDPEVFTALQTRIVPALVRNRSPEQPIRVWVPGCSTGEEPYSIAIALLESLGALSLNIPVQIFATDVNQRSIERARSGLFLENIAVDVSPPRMQRFFHKINQQYQVSKAVRELCVFSKHDITKDPPYSNIDLVSCRNLLIYMSSTLQREVIPALHYSLKPGGFLVLGSSESPVGYPDLFAEADGAHKIFSKVPARGRVMHWLSNEARFAQSGKLPHSHRELQAHGETEVAREADRVALDRYCHSGVLVRGAGRIVQLRGNVSPYLASGDVRENFALLDVVREDLQKPLRTALERASDTGTPARAEGIRLPAGQADLAVDIEVLPVSVPGDERHFLVLFEPSRKRLATGEPGEPVSSEEGLEILRLQQNLQSTTAHLHSIIEELRGAHEEALSNNEELQSVNEEIETGKEELQSTNEELATLNDELRTSNAELAQALADLRNLLASVQMPIIFLGPSLEIRMFTPAAQKVFNFIAADVGRKLSDIRPNLEFDNLLGFIQEAIARASLQEAEARDHDGNWYLVRATPSVTDRGEVRGAILTLVDIGNRKRAEEEREQMLARIERERTQFELVIEHMPSAVIVAEAPSGRIILANPQVEALLGNSLRIGEGLERIHRAGFHPDGTAFDPEEWPLARAVNGGEVVINERMELVRADGTRLMLRTSAAPIRDRAGRIIAALLVFDEVTDLLALRERLAQTERITQSQRLETIGRLAGGVAHDFNNLLTVITGYAQFVHDDPALPSHLGKHLETAIRSANRAAALTSQLLAFSRRQMIRPEVLDLNQTVVTVEVMLRRLIGEHIELRTSLSPVACFVNADAGQIEQIILNLATNARDAVENGGTITIETARVELGPGPDHPGGSYSMLAVSDTGAGMDEETRGHLFEPFFTTKGVGKGTGLGLASVYGIVKQHRGEVRVDSEPGKGTRFEIYLPCVQGRARTEQVDVPAEVPGVETILVVEDEPGVRQLARGILEKAGYSVLEARNGEEALRVYQQHRGVVSVVLTDVVMPEMHGNELAQRLLAVQPGLKVLYMSGYPRDVTGSYGVLESADRFLQKPFSPHELTRKIRLVLDSAETAR